MSSLVSLDIQSSFVKVWPWKVIAIISAWQHYFKQIVYLNPGQGWYFFMVAHYGNENFIFTGILWRQRFDHKYINLSWLPKMQF